MVSDRKRIAVIGGGTMGSMAAWRIAERGVPVTVFEQFSPGHDRSAAGGESRIFRTAYVEGPEYIPLLRRARDLWRELERTTGRELLQKTGMLTIAPEDSDEFQNALTGVTEYRLDCEVISGTQVTRRFPQHTVMETDSGILDRTAGSLRPELSVVMAAQRAEQIGAEIWRYTKAESIHPDGNGVTVCEGGQKHRFDTVIIATGPWLTRLLPQLNRIVETQRRLGAWYIPKTPSLWNEGERRLVFARTGGKVRYYGIPSVDGISIKMGVTSDMDDPVVDPDELDRTVELARLEPYRDVIAEFLPDLNPDPIRVGAYQEGYTPDRAALLGFMPCVENVIVAGGFSGHGFKLAPCVGEIVADLVTSGETAFDIGFLAPDRYLD